MQFWSHLSNFLQGSLCSDPLPSILLQNFWNGFFGKGSSLRRVPWMIMTPPEYFLKSKQSKRCRPGNQLDKAAQERGHRVITHARQRTLSHHVSLQSRDAMASIPSFWHYATELWIGSPGKALAGIATWWQERKDFWQLAPMGGAYPWLPLQSLSCHLNNRSRDCLGSSSLPLTCTCSAPPHDPAHRGDFRNPHSLNSTCLHQRQKMETSRIRQRQRLSRYFYGRGGGLASTSTTLRQPPISWSPPSSPSWSWSPPSPPLLTSTSGNPGSWQPRT